MQFSSQLTFYGYEQRGNISRLFKVYATSNGLYFGWIADRDYEEMMARFGGAGIGQNAGAMQETARGAKSWESHYDTMNVESAQFARAHDDNFSFAPADGAAMVTWKLKFTEKAATRFGALDLVSEGKKRRFYLVGQRAPAEVAQAVRAALPAATIEPLPGDAPAVAAVAGETVSDETVYKRPNWPVLISSYVAAILLSLWVAATFNFWIPLGACAVAIPAYRMLRFGGLAANYHKNAAEQLRRNRAHKK